MKTKDNRVTLSELLNNMDEQGNLNPELLKHYEVVRTSKSIKFNYKGNKK